MQSTYIDGDINVRLLFSGFMKTNCNEDVIQIDASKFDGPWSFKNETIFIDLMEEEVAKGNRPTTTFTRTSWAYIKEQLYVKTGYAYTHDQLKNKYNSLRHRYKEFKRLLSDINGKGWDPVLGTITLEEEQWTNLIKVHFSITIANLCLYLRIKLLSRSDKLVNFCRLTRKLRSSKRVDVHITRN